MNGRLNSGSIIKSIQQGSGSNIENSDIDINISSVDVNKSIILFNSTANGGNWGTYDLDGYKLFKAEFLNDSKIRLHRTLTSRPTNAFPVYMDYFWRVIEFQ